MLTAPFRTRTQHLTRSWRTFVGTSQSSWCFYASSRLYVHSRFILNLPDDEVAQITRVFWQVEQACAPLQSMHAPATDAALSAADIGFTTISFDHKIQNALRLP